MYYIQRADQPSQFRAKNGDWVDAQMAHGFGILEAAVMPIPPEGGVWVEAKTRDYELQLAYKPSTPAAVPVPAPELQADDLQAMVSLLSWAERQVCYHDETERRGAIWEVCLQCGSQWADDKGGKPEFKWPADIERGRAVLDRLKAKALKS